MIFAAKTRLGGVISIWMVGILVAGGCASSNVKFSDLRPPTYANVSGNTVTINVGSDMMNSACYTRVKAKIKGQSVIVVGYRSIKMQQREVKIRLPKSVDPQEVRIFWMDPDGRRISLADPNVLSDDLSRLAALKITFLETQSSGRQFGPAFWLTSKRLAQERGPAILHAIMKEAQNWQGEEGLVFVPLVALLPRDPTLEILGKYESSGRETDRIWAAEFITELDMSDTQQAVQKYSR